MSEHDQRMSRRTAVQRGTFSVAVLLSSAGIGRLLGGRAAAQAPVSSTRRLEAGRQLVVVYVGSSRCGPSNASGVSQVISGAIAAVRNHATAMSLGFVSVGVAKELSVKAGLEHLEKIGGFDEVCAGMGVLNQGSAHFIARDHRGVDATPQIVVVERHVQALGEGGIDPSNVEEVVLTRKLGTVEIRSWVELGAPIPKVHSD